MPCSGATNGSSCSMAIVWTGLSLCKAAMKSFHQAASWPRPTTAKFQGRVWGSRGQRRSSSPFRSMLALSTRSEGTRLRGRLTHDELRQEHVPARCRGWLFDPPDHRSHRHLPDLVPRLMLGGAGALAAVDERDVLVPEPGQVLDGKLRTAKVVINDDVDVGET